jgi:hypothetical protein
MSTKPNLHQGSLPTCPFSELDACKNRPVTEASPSDWSPAALAQVAKAANAAIVAMLIVLLQQKA